MRSALLLTFGPPTYGTCLRWVCTLDGHSIAINICPWKCSKQANKFHQYVLRELFSRLQDFGCLNLFSVMTVKIDKERMFYGSHSLQGFTWAYHTGLVVFFFFTMHWYQIGTLYQLIPKDQVLELVSGGKKWYWNIRLLAVAMSPCLRQWYQ